MKRLLTLFLALLTMAAGPAWAQATSSTPPPLPSLWAQYPALGWGLAAVLGGVLGAWLTARQLRRHYRARIHQVRLQTREEGTREVAFKTARSVKPPTDYELKVREENTRLRQQVSELTRQLAQGPTQQVGAPPLPAVEVVDTAEPLDSKAVAAPSPTENSPSFPALEEKEPTPEGAREVPALEPAPRYAPAQQTAFLPDSKLAAEPLPQLPLLLSFRPDDPARASFTLSPHVNQAKLIGDGLHQLREFFDFELPAGRLVAVSADAPGQLVRQADGWLVVQRARLLVR